jgi:hypothetical protein
MASSGSAEIGNPADKEYKRALAFICDALTRDQNVKRSPIV